MAERPTIDEMRARLGIPPDASADGYLAPVPYSGGCINCGGQTMEIEGGCALHCEGCCDCEEGG